MAARINRSWHKQTMSTALSLTEQKHVGRRSTKVMDWTIELSLQKGGETLQPRGPCNRTGRFSGPIRLAERSGMIEALCDCAQRRAQMTQNELRLRLCPKNEITGTLAHCNLQGERC